MALRFACHSCPFKVNTVGVSPLIFLTNWDPLGWHAKERNLPLRKLTWEEWRK